MIRPILRLGWHSNVRFVRLATCRPCSSLDLPNHSTVQSSRTKASEQWSDDSELTVKEVSNAADSVQRSSTAQRAPAAQRTSTAKRASATQQASNAQPESTEARKPSKQTDQTPNQSLSNKKLRGHLNQTLGVVKNEESLKRALSSLWPVLKPLKLDQLRVAFEVLSELPAALKRRGIMSRKATRWVLQRAQLLELLLNRGHSHISELDPASLTALFRLLVKMGRTEDDLVRNTIEQLDARLDALSLKQLSEVWACTDYFMKHSASRKIVTFRKRLLERLRARTLDPNELNGKNLDLLVQLFDHFLVNREADENFEVVKHLLEMLLWPETRLNFDHSVSLLCSVRKAYREPDESTSSPGALAPLIDRCNSAVLEQLESRPSSKAHHYLFLEEVYRTPSWFPKYFPNFCDPELLDRMAAYFAGDRDAKAGNLRPEHAAMIRNLLFCYSKVGLYNEQLIELFYRLVCNGRFLADQFTPAEYHLLANYRWPFVDHQRLLKALKSSKKFLDVRTSASTYSGMLCQLLLHETTDQELLRHLNENSRPYQVKDSQLYLDNYKQTTLAREVLEMFCDLDDNDLKLDLKRTLDKRLRELSQSLSLPNVRSKFVPIDKRLQEGGYLSNGVYVDVFAIFDHTIRGLVPLNQFKKHFKEIDLIPLTKQQEL